MDLAAGKPAQISASVRTAIRTIQPFLAEAATTNRQLALHCHLTTKYNYQCRYHQIFSKRSKVRDRSNPPIGQYAVTGIPGPRIIAKCAPPTTNQQARMDASAMAIDPLQTSIDGTTPNPADSSASPATAAGKLTNTTNKTDTEEDGTLSVEDGYMSCGCLEEEVLTEFFFWKTWTATSPKNGITEGFADQFVDPRTRTFIVSAFKRMTGLSVEDLYSHGHGETENRKRILRVQIERLTNELNELNGGSTGGDAPMVS